MVERRVAKGEAVFRYGDPGDSMFVLLRGQIGIWLPAAHTEVDASRAAGVSSRSRLASCSAIWVCSPEPRARPMRSLKAMR